MALVYVASHPRPFWLQLTPPGFYVNLPAGALAAAAMVVLHIPEQQKKQNPSSLLPRLHHHLDLIGFILFAPAVLMLLLALQFGGEAYPWNSSEVIGLFCGSVAVFVVWFFWNRYRGDEAMIPYSIISRRDVLASGVYEAFLMSAVYGGIYYLPIYFQAVNNASPMLSGVYLLPMILAQLFMAGAAGGAGKSCPASLPASHCCLQALILGYYQTYSDENWLCNTNSRLLHHIPCCWKRSLLDSETWKSNGRVGWFPNYSWLWFWCRSAIGKLILSFHILYYYNQS
jgi:hypothetical protein